MTTSIVVMTRNKEYPDVTAGIQQSAGVCWDKYAILEIRIGVDKWRLGNER